MKLYLNEVTHTLPARLITLHAFTFIYRFWIQDMLTLILYIHTFKMDDFLEFPVAKRMICYSPINTREGIQLMEICHQQTWKPRR